MSGNVNNSFDGEGQNHWKWGIFYCNTEDKRLLVPKKVPIMGYTLNFGHKYAVLFLGAITVLAITLVFVGKK